MLEIKSGQKYFVFVFRSFLAQMNQLALGICNDVMIESKVKLTP